MDDDKPEIVESLYSFKDKHSFLLFISISILISSVVVAISMAMYNGSGAAQLDLSRPGYKDVRSQVDVSEGDFQNYSANGPIDRDVISNFKAIYDKQAQKVKSVDAFGGDPLSAEALGIGSQSD
jgi:hypothetical protein